MKLLPRALLAAALLAAPLAAAAPAHAAAPSDQDTAFMVAAHQSNLTEIAAGKAAQGKAVSDGVRSMGEMLITDHTALDAALTKTAKALGVTLPDAPSAAQQQTLAAVSAKSGTAFDQAWIASQLAGHQKAKADGATEIAQGSDPQAIAAARAAAPVVQRHLTMLTELGDGTTPSGVNGGTGGQAAAGRSWYVLPAAAVGLALLVLAVMLPRRRRSAVPAGAIPTGAAPASHRA